MKTIKHEIQGIGDRVKGIENAKMRNALCSILVVAATIAYFIYAAHDGGRAEAVVAISYLFVGLLFAAHLSGLLKIERWLLSIFVVLALIVVADIGLGALKKNPYETEILKTYDAAFGIKNIPNLEKEVTYDGTKDGDLLKIYNVDPSKLPARTDTESNTFQYTMDRFGFRNPEGLDPRTADVWIIGDSQVIASSLPIEKTWTGIVRDEENKKNVKVYQAAVNQIGPVNYAQFLKTLAANATPSEKPRLAIITFFEGNDLDAPEFFVPKQNYGLSSYLRFFVEKIRQKKMGSNPLLDPTKAIEAGQQKLFFLPYVNLAARTIEQIKSNWAYPTVQNSFKDMSATCTQYKLNCIVIFIPTKFHTYLPGNFNYAAYGEAVGETVAADNYTTEKFTKNNGNMEKVIEEIVTSTGLKFVSLTEPLQKATKQSQTYWPYDTHLNAWGNSVVAQQVLGLLQ